MMNLIYISTTLIVLIFVKLITKKPKGVLPKSKWQIEVETTKPITARKEKRRITKEVKGSPCKVGEIVTVTQWGTFGCWDEKNRWVDFWNSEPVYGITKWHKHKIKIIV